MNEPASSRVIASLIGIVLASHVSFAAAADDTTQSGKELYVRHCASCHGASGRGDGPVAKSLAVEVPDLTRYAQRHRQRFDRERVERIIDGRFLIGAHGTRTMPVWGEAFSLADLGDPDAERATRLKIDRLTDYVQQLQHQVASSDAKQESR